MLLSKIAKIEDGKIWIKDSNQQTIDEKKKETGKWVTVKGEEGHSRKILLGKGGIIKGGDTPKELQGTKIGSKEMEQKLNKEAKKKTLQYFRGEGPKPKSVEIKLKKEKKKAVIKPKKKKSVGLLPNKKLKIVSTKEFLKIYKNRESFTLKIKDLDLRSVNFTKIEDMIHLQFENCNFSGRKLPNMFLDSVQFKNCNMVGCNLKNSDMVDCEFKNVDMEDADLSDSYIDDSCEFYDVDLTNSNLKNIRSPESGIKPIFRGPKTEIKGSEVSGISKIGLPLERFIGCKLNGKEITKGQVKYLNNIIKKSKAFEKEIGPISKSVINKKNIATLLSKKTGIPKDIDGIKKNMGVRQYIEVWAETSGDHNPNAIFIQQTAKELFKMKNTYEEHLKSKKKSKMDKQETTKLLKAQYEETQKLLKNKGIKELFLYRGVKDSYKGESKVKLQPLSSFSLDRDEAKSFGPNIMQMIVPAEKIFSCPLTGFGCTDEKEVVILGGEYKVAPSVLHAEDYFSAINVLTTL
jgi:hypothetical protein